MDCLSACNLTCSSPFFCCSCVGLYIARGFRVVAVIVSPWHDMFFLVTHQFYLLLIFAEHLDSSLDLRVAGLNLG